MNPLAAADLARLTAGADAADRSPDWPAESWEILRSGGVLGWSVPREYGGAGVGPVELLQGSEAIAAACLTTAFILSQREAAVRRLSSGPPHLKERYFPGLAAGELFLTVGLSQLTTSRRHQGPALRATPTTSGGFRLDGEAPWVTSADRAAALVLGATLPDARQLLVVLPADRAGLRIEPPLLLAALNGSRTTRVRCEGVEVEGNEVLAGPTEHVLGAVGGGGLETSCLALGLARAAADYLRQEASVRANLVAAADRFTAAVDTVRGQLHRLATASSLEAALALRVECTELVLRATQAALLAARGTGFTQPHPAQRWARQALFFLVWSCPGPVSEGLWANLLG